MNTTDQRIDQLLHALGTKTAPLGMEQRINARLAQQAAPRKHNSSLFGRSGGSIWTSHVPHLALWPSLLTLAVIVLGTGSLFHLTHTQPLPLARESVPAKLPQMPSVQHTTPVSTPGLKHVVVSERQEAITERQVSSPLDNDPDAIALAETFAPSHVAPPMPLSEQETAMQYHVRRGAPIEVASFDARYEPAASALAAARERANVREFVHGLLGPLVTAQSLTSSPRPDDTPTVPDPEPQSFQ